MNPQGGRPDSHRERTLLVCVARNRPVDGSRVAELTELVASNLLEVAGAVRLRRDRPDPATFVGSGKLEEIAQTAREAGATLLVFDAPLSAAQERNIERLAGIPVIDRTELILEIFRKRAKSREGRLQVELARLEHALTRLVRGWTHLERQRGGLGKTGGPGEKQLELDRRLIAGRIRKLKDELKTLSRQRRTQRRARNASSIPTLSVVGYTNAGKTTLFNAMTGSEVYAADRLFATLDTTARRAWLQDERHAVLADTVGFIRDLPHQLVEAFKSTLDETVSADVLLHVVDASSPVKDEQMASVAGVLEEIGAETIPQIVVFNKIDKTGEAAAVLRDEKGRVTGVRASALTGEGLDLLRQAIVEKLEELAEASEEADAEDWDPAA